jgi:hypothetical protein
MSVFFENEIPCAKEPLQKRRGMNQEIRALPEADQMARGVLPITIEGARQYHAVQIRIRTAPIFSVGYG